MRRLLVVLMMALVSMSLLSGCYGKFALTKKVYNLNGQVSDRFLRSGLTWVFVIVPVYEIAFLVDFIAFNTMEFWSGSNPVVSGENDFEYVKGEDTFQIHAAKTGDMVNYTIKHYNKTGLVDTTFINWDIKTGKSVVSTNKDGLAREYVASKDDGKIRVEEYANGKVRDIVWYTPGGTTSAGQFAAVR